MSMAMTALVASPLPMPSAVEVAAKAIGFDFGFEAPEQLLDALAGFRPMTFRAPREMEAGVEIYVETAHDFASEHGVAVDPAFSHAIWFRFARMEELYSALVLCAALANLGARVYADEEGAFKTAQELTAEANSTLDMIKPRKRP